MCGLQKEQNENEQKEANKRENGHISSENGRLSEKEKKGNCAKSICDV